MLDGEKREALWTLPKVCLLSGMGKGGEKESPGLKILTLRVPEALFLRKIPAAEPAAFIDDSSH